MRHPTVVLALAVVAAGCGDVPLEVPSSATEVTPMSALSSSVVGLPAAMSIDELNAQLAAAGAPYAIAKAEYVLAAEASGPLADAADHTVFANNRQLRLPSRWVPGDTRRDADGNRLTYVTYRGAEPAFGLAVLNASGVGDPAAVEAAIDNSFATWNAMQCSNVELVRRDEAGFWPSAVFNLGGNPYVADIVTIGFLPGIYFDAFVGAGASQNVLGVTFTFVFGTNMPDGTFVPSDVDNDGRNDTALKEVWYNNAFLWRTNPTVPGTDIETVALHENGHALELGHFGMIHATFNNGKGNNRPGTLHVSPRAVMNAIILGDLRAPLGTDNAAYCGNFSDWPS